METITLNTQKTEEKTNSTSDTHSQPKIKNASDHKMFSYTGSKEKFGEQFNTVLDNMNNGEKINVKYYIEGFSGSLMSLFHNLQRVNSEYIVINDLNPKLINLYKQIQENPELVFEGYKMIEEKFNSLIPVDSPIVRIYPVEKREEITDIKKLYYYIREQVNTLELDWLHSSCMLFVLNHNFNGLYSENKKGNVNVSFNWNTKPIDTNRIKESLFNLSEFFNTHNVIFESLDIDTLTSNYNHSDTFIYLDPPYIDSVVQYNTNRKKENSFNLVETHINLLNKVNSQYKYVMYSNNHHEMFVELSDGYVNFHRGKYSGGKKETKEILSYKINDNEPVNNTSYKPEIIIDNELPLQKTGTDNLEVINNSDYISVDSDYNLSLGTIFSGLGCSEEVLKELNIPHTSEFVCDNNKFCRQTLEINYSPKRIYDNVCTLNGKELPQTDLFIWGSPCQDLSQSNNNREGLNGEKSKLFFEGYRILQELQPKYSIFENVQGLLSSNGGEDFKTVMRLFEELGNYDIYWKKINPVDIGGMTTRIRVFVILIRKDINIPYNFPVETGSTKSIKDIMVVGEHKYYPEDQFVPWERPVEKQRGKLRKDSRWLCTKRVEDERVFNINHFCPTLKRKCFVLINDGIGVRELTIPELIEIQGLGGIDFSHLSDTQIKSQLGNTMEFTTMKKLIGEIVRIDKIHYNRQKENKELLVS